MHALRGEYFDGKTAAVQAAELHIDATGNARFEPAVVAGPLHLRDIRIDARISGLPAVLRLPNGARFQTRDHETLERCLQQAGLAQGWSRLHRLERRRSIAVGAAVLVLGIAAAGYQWGLPLAGRILAPLVPETIVAALGETVLEQLDGLVFSPSQLDEDRRAQLRDRFRTLSAGLDLPAPPRLEFRNGGFIDANAFALPDGTVVMTDQLVQIAADDDQLFAVLLHELGHVAHRHTMRQVIQRTGIGVIALMVFGDVSGVGSVLAALPAVLLETAFSRDMEREADDFAAAEMRARGIPLQAFTGFFTRMDDYYRSCRGARRPDNSLAQDAGGADRPGDAAAQNGDGAPDGTDDRPNIADIVLGGEPPAPPPPMDVAAVRECLDVRERGTGPAGAGDARGDTERDGSGAESGRASPGWIGYLSTHPATAERIERIERLQQP